MIDLEELRKRANLILDSKSSSYIVWQEQASYFREMCTPALVIELLDRLEEAERGAGSMHNVSDENSMIHCELAKVSEERDRLLEVLKAARKFISVYDGWGSAFSDLNDAVDECVDIGVEK